MKERKHCNKLAVCQGGAQCNGLVSRVFISSKLFLQQNLFCADISSK